LHSRSFRRRLCAPLIRIWQTHCATSNSTLKRKKKGSEALPFFF
jgi:hypothetical protein